MKKFIIFSIAAIVIATMGLMTYRFLTLEESILVNQTVFEINIGDELPLEVEHINPKSTTHIVYESLNEDVIEVVNYLGEDKFVTKGTGGKAVLRISANIKNFAPIILSVTVGDGKESTPFFVKDAQSLAQIGKIEEGEEVAKLPLDAYYTLTSDIDLSTYNEGEWTPIGKGSEDGFTGVFNANGHTISGIKVTEATDYAGLFAKIGSNNKNKANIYGDLVLSNCNINGEFNYAGALAGENNGRITKVSVLSSNISSIKNQAMVGGLVGRHTGDIEKAIVLNSDVSSNADATIAGGLVGFMVQTKARPTLMMSYCEGVDVSATMYIGGLVGNVKSGLVGACYAKALGNKGLVTNFDQSVFVTCVGGLVGRLEMVTSSDESEIDDCYSTANIQAVGNSTIVGNLIGQVDTKTLGTDKVMNKLFGLYYDGNANGYHGIGQVDSEKINSSGADSEEKSFYPYVYNTLSAQLSSETVDKYISFTTIQDFEEIKIFWNHDLVFNFSNEAYPTINFDGMWQSIYPYGNSNEPTYITSITQLISMRDCVNNPDTDIKQKLAVSNWVLCADIDLSGVSWEPIGTIEHPFNGTFTSKAKDNGENYKITGLTISTGSDGSGLQDKGFFGIIGGQGLVMNITIENPSVRYGQSVGSLAGVNYGIITNCKVISNGSSELTENIVQSNNNTYIGKDVFVGGLVGYNNGVIRDSKVNGIKVSLATTKSELVGYIGGLTGFNNGTITDCFVNSVIGSHNEISSAAGREQYVGGITSMNNYIIRSSYINGYKITVSASNKNTYVGGVVAYNGGDALLSRSFAKDMNIEGTNIGGVVGLTYGRIEQCYFDGAAAGKYVGGIAYSVANGTVNDCYASGSLFGVDEDSVKAGLAYTVALVSEDEYQASMDHCYTSVNYSAPGENYCDTSSAVRADKLDSVFIYIVKRRAGYLFNSIYDRTNADESIATRSDSKSWPWDHNDYRNPDKLISDYNSDRWLYSYKYDTGMTTEEIKSEAGANVFRTYGYDESIWILDGVNYPTLRNVPTVE